METNFPNGVASYGVSLSPRSSLIHAGVGVDNGKSQPRANKHFYVHAAAGNDANDGLSPDAPMKTITAVMLRIGSGDVIHLNGKFTENVTTPVGVFDVTIIGEGNRPRHADLHTTYNGYSTADWRASSSSSPNLKIMQQGWRIVNILFVGASSSACVQLYRDGGADSAERDASHTEFYNCRFASGQDGIEDSGGCGHVGIYDCYFTDLTGVALKQTTGAGIGQPYFRWDVQYNRFQDCPSLTTAKAAQFFRFMFNTVSFASAPTLVFNFTSGKQNIIIRNVFNIAAADFDPAGGVTGSGATDVWSNTLTDAIETGLPAN